MLDEVMKELLPKMEERLSRFTEELKTIRVGKAESSLVENLPIAAYSTTLPLKQIASISTPTPNTILISPWDKSVLKAIEQSIRESDLSLNPVNDGQVIKIFLPPLSRERREELLKVVRRKGEETKVALRMLRQEAWQQIVKAEREHQVSEDERYRGEEELNKTIEKFNRQIDEIVERKKEEMMRV